MLTINTNLSSLIAQNSLKQSSTKLNTAIERMSTGCKINHAKDNSANYSISTNMTTKMGALQVAEENALQGIEMMSTTSENLSLIEDKLIRMRTLAVQAQNGTYGEKSLKALSAEADTLLSEINRINETATYNGIKLFNTGKAEVTNAGKELKLNEQGFLQDVVKVDTTGMTALGSMADDAMLAVGEYTISSKAELVQLKEMSDDGLLEAGSTFVLTKDIDMSGITDWNGIGAVNAFRGHFNGNGYKISNLVGSNGLFALVSGAANSKFEIKNIKIENIKITGAGWNIAAVVGDASGTKVFNCSVVKGQVSSNSGQQHAGIVGYGYYAALDSCYFKGDVSGVSYVGGIQGFANYSEIRNCSFEGSVLGTKNYLGGVVGLGVAVNSKAIATVRGVKNVGGISGERSGSGSYFSGVVIGDSNVGGICGVTSQFTNVANCIMEGFVEGTTNVGIFAGEVTAGKMIENCYYYGKNVKNLEFAGNMDTATILNVVDTTIPCDYSLQISSSGDDETSTVSCTTYIDFSGLKDLLSSGIESSNSIEKIDELTNIVSLKQTELGMMEQRLYSVLDEISIKYENIVSSRSTILDADISEVSASYIQQQILQQASATLMATANQSPSIALQLI